MIIVYFCNVLLYEWESFYIFKNYIKLSLGMFNLDVLLLKIIFYILNESN